METPKTVFNYNQVTEQVSVTADFPRIGLRFFRANQKMIEDAWKIAMAIGTLDQVSKLMEILQEMQNVISAELLPAKPALKKPILTIQLSLFERGEDEPIHG